MRYRDFRINYIHVKDGAEFFLNKVIRAGTAKQAENLFRKSNEQNVILNIWSVIK